MPEARRRAARHGRVRGRLHWRIFVAVLASVVTVALLAALAWQLGGQGEVGSSLEAAAEIAAEVLPGAAASPEAQRAALERWHRRTRASFAIYAPSAAGAGPAGEPIASAGEPIPPPPASRTASGFFRTGLGPPIVALRLPDGRWLVVRHPRRPGTAVGFLHLLLLVAAVVGLVAYPVSRRLTRRLSSLEESVDALGAGDLGVRVDVEGRDEVASLAESFNRAATRIEALVGAQKRLLAHASHELRSPLARLRVAASLLEGDARLKSEIEQNVTELDGLVEEILLASRLEAGAGDEKMEPVDLTALAAEEAARAGASVSGELLSVTGSARLLRRMVRNLVENAVRHGGGSPVEISLAKIPSGLACLDVSDRGPGVPAEARERIFEPFFRLPAPQEGQGGTGLGLSLARQVARLHGGDVVCLPREGGGTTFRATLRGRS